MKSLCYITGTCLCGKPLFKTWLQQFTTVLKSLFKKGGPHKAHAERGMLVAKLDFNLGRSHRPVASHWLHLTYANQNSWLVGITEMHLDQDEIAQSIASARGYTALRAGALLEEIEFKADGTVKYCFSDK